MKLLFKPVGMLGGLVAGLVARKAFELVWAAIDGQDPPLPEHRRAGLAKLAAALALEGAIFSLARGLTDHGARSVFAALTGAWPGTEAPEAATREAPEGKRPHGLPVLS